MFEEFVMELQLFAMPEDEKRDPQDEPDEDDEDLDEEGDEEEEDGAVSGAEIDQEAFDAAFSKAYGKVSHQRDRELKKLFGTSDLSKIAEAFHAGQEVAQAAKVTPQQIRERLRQQGAGPVGHPQATPSASNEDIRQIKDMLESQEHMKAREREKAAAVKTFGNIFYSHESDIEELAEDKGLSVNDAAAIVLAPHIKKQTEQQVKAQQKHGRKKRIEGSEEGAQSEKSDYRSQLSQAELNVARQMGVTPKEYYEYKKKR